MTKRWFPWWISYFQALHLLNRLFSGQTIVVGSFTWNDLCWVGLTFTTKKTNNPTWGSSLFPPNTTNWICLFLSLLHLIPLLMSHLGARSWLWPNNLKNKFYNNKCGIFFPRLCHTGVCTVVLKMCGPTWRLWLPGVPWSAGTVLCSAEVVNWSLVATVVYLSALWSILKWNLLSLIGYKCVPCPECDARITLLACCGLMSKGTARKSVRLPLKITKSARGYGAAPSSACFFFCFHSK